MYDSMTAEAEVLEFLRTLVTTLKPALIVETALSSAFPPLWMAEGLRAQRLRPHRLLRVRPHRLRESAREDRRLRLGDYIELRNESSLEMHVEGTIDILFSDSDMPIRAAEVKRFLPQIRPTGLILLHDASSHLHIVREAAKDLEREGLVSCIFLPTPRGLVLAQKREGRV